MSDERAVRFAREAAISAERVAELEAQNELLRAEVERANRHRDEWRERAVGMQAIADTAEAERDAAREALRGIEAVFDAAAEKTERLREEGNDVTVLPAVRKIEDIARAALASTVPSEEQR